MKSEQALYGAFFVKGFRRRNAFDRKAVSSSRRAFCSRRRAQKPVQVGRRTNLSACSALAGPYLDGFQHDGTLDAIGARIRGELAIGRGSSRRNLVFGRSMLCSSGPESLSEFCPHAARNMTPAGTSPVVTRRHRAISTAFALFSCLRAREGRCATWSSRRRGRWSRWRPRRLARCLRRALAPTFRAGVYPLARAAPCAAPTTIVSFFANDAGGDGA